MASQHSRPKIVVITADVVGSKMLPAEQLERLQERLESLNHDLGQMLASKFVTSRGDEIQGIPSSPALIPRIIRKLRLRIRPVQLRIGIGLGDVEGPVIDPANPWNMNGPAFYLAREALDELKADRKRHTLCKTGSATNDRLLNTIWYLLDSIEARWTSEQWAAVDAYDSLGTYKAASEALGIALQNVEKRCSAARWQAVHDAEELLGDMFAEFTGGTVKQTVSPTPG